MTRTALWPWPLHPLGDLVDVMDGRRVPVNAKERARRPGQVPYYGAAGQVGWIDQPLFDEDLLLLGEDGVQFFDPAKSKAYRISGPSWVNNHAHVLRARNSVDWRYLEHYLNWFDYQGYANGTTRLKLTQAAMKRIPVPLPETPEQRRIVELLEDHLSHLDAANDYLSAAERRTRSLAQSALDGLVWTPDVPTVPLASLLREPMRNGYSARASATGSVRVLTLTAVTRRTFTNEFTKMIDAAPERVRGLWLEPGDVFVQRANTPELVGSAALYDGEPGWAVFPDLLIRLRVDPALMTPQFLALALQTERCHRALRARAKGLAGSMPKVDQGAIAALDLPCPSLEDQHRIVAEAGSRVASVRALSDAALMAQRRSLALRRGVLDAAFSGRLSGWLSGSESLEELTFA